MPSTTRSITIHAPIEKIHKVVCDFESYPKFFPEVRAVEVIKHTKKAALVKFIFHFVKTITALLKFDISTKKISWVLVKGDFMKANQGSWHLEEKKDKSTEVTYSTEIIPSMWVPNSFVEKHMTSIVPVLLRHVKSLCEHGKSTQHKVSN